MTSVWDNDLTGKVAENVGKFVKERALDQMTTDAMQSPSLSPILERHTPQHPLPEGIQNMGQEGTVCQFCGVSYLIHREIKKLEDRIEELEKEIEKGRKALRNELILREELQTYDEKNKVLALKVSEKDCALQEAERNMVSLSGKLDNAYHEAEQLKETNDKLKNENLQHKKQMVSTVKCLLNQVRQAKTELLDLKYEVDPVKTGVYEDIDTMKIKILDVISNWNSENATNDRTIQELREGLASSKKNEELLQATIRLMENELKEATIDKEKIYDELKVENERLCEQFVTVQSRNTELLQDIATLQSQLGLSKSDSIQISEALGLKKQELQSTMQKLHKIEKDSEVTIRRLNQEIKILENDIKVIQNEKNKWKEVEKNLLSQNSRLQAFANSTFGETKQVTEQMENLRNELGALKSERGQMIISHQNQIHQLKETFREKLRKAHGDPGELEEKIHILKKSHKQEMMELESHLKERHDIELALQREKHEEERKAYNQQHRDMSENDSLEWKRQVDILSNDLNVSNNMVHTLKSEHSRNLEETHKEKTELKDIIGKLEKRIIDLTGEHDDATIDIQVELKDTKRKLTEAIETKNEMEHKSMLLMKEVCILQETVRRECEERFELTEALSRIQEQIKMGNTSNGTPLHTPVSAINKVRRQNSLPSHETNESTYSRNGFQRHSSRTSLESLADVKNGDLSPHVKDIMFNNKNSSMIRNLSDAKSEELAENARRRIAEAIKRK